jgi:cell division protein FtsB
MNGNFLKKIRKKIDVSALFADIWANKKLSAILAFAVVVLLYILFNNQGVIQRIRLEQEKKELLQKIQVLEKEQKQLQEQSKALEGDKKAIEKVAREKYGMVREGEKVYRVAPKK